MINMKYIRICTHDNFHGEPFPLAVPRNFLGGKNGKIRHFHFFEELVTLRDLIIQPPAWGLDGTAWVRRTSFILMMKLYDDINFSE